VSVTRPGLGIIEPCLPSPAKAPPSGPGWVHEIKHDGFRIMARRGANGVRLITRNGNDFTARFPLAAAAVGALPANSFLIDGEAIVTNAKGLAVFDLIRRKHHGDNAVLIAFDLIELDGQDMCRAPLEDRKRKLAKLVRGPHPGIVLNEFFEGDGDILFEHACKLGCEGIVSKRLGSPYRSGRSAHWVKVVIRSVVILFCGCHYPAFVHGTAPDIRRSHGMNSVRVSISKSNGWRSNVLA
jgi:bifunctional non-homologous end joining protein LigD